MGIHIPSVEEKALLKAMEVKDTDRFQTMEEFRKCLPIDKKNPPPPPPPWKKWIILIAAVLIISITPFVAYKQSGSPGKSYSKPATTAPVVPSEKAEPTVAPTKATLPPSKAVEPTKPTKPPCSIHSWPETSSGSTIVCTQCGAKAIRKDNVSLTLKGGDEKKNLAQFLISSEHINMGYYILNSIAKIAKMGITIEFDEITSGNPDGNWVLYENGVSNWDELGQVQYQSTGNIKLDLIFNEPKECWAFCLTPPAGSAQDNRFEGYYSFSIDYAYVLE